MTVDRSYSLALGKVVRALREERALNQTKLAKECSLSRNNVAALEAGRANPTLATLWQVSAVFGLSPAELLAEVERSAPAR